MNTVKERLISYLKEKKISKSEFGRRIEVSSAYITSMRNSIAPAKLEKIKQEFPDLNITWLLTGDGEMLNDITIPASAVTSKPMSPTAVPVYDIDFMGGFSPVYTDAVERVGDINLQRYNGATAVVSVSGDSMYPAISSGDQIIIKEMPVSMDSIIYGNIYALETDNDLRTVKRVRKSSKPGCLDLEPINKDVADTTTIDANRVIHLWLVLGCIKPLM